MMPNTSVRPAAIRKSMTPSCSPFRHCSTTSKTVTRARRRTALTNERGAARPRPVPRTRSRALPLHRALVTIRILVVLEDGLLNLHLDVPARLHRLEEVEVLDGVVIVVVLVRAARRLVVRLAHGGDHALLVAEVALHGADGGVDEHDPIVALGAVERRRVVELLLEVAHVLLVGGVLEIGA